LSLVHDVVEFNKMQITVDQNPSCPTFLLFETFTHRFKTTVKYLGAKIGWEAE